MVNNKTPNKPRQDRTISNVRNLKGERITFEHLSNVANVMQTKIIGEGQLNP